ncbi:unnamed protein product [Calypogeia fissa]
MALSLSHLFWHTNSSLHAIHAEGGVNCLAPTPPSLGIHSNLPNFLHKSALAGSSSTRLLSSLKTFRAKAPLRFPLWVAERHMSVDVVCSSPPRSTNWSGQTTKRSSISLKRRAVSEENAAEVPVKPDLGFLPPGWPTVALALFGLGFVLGPPLDAIHSRVDLQVYDNGAINLLGLKTNIWVPPLLGVFYSVAGLLSLVLDKKFARKGNIPTANLNRVATSLVALAVLLELSAELYKAGVPANIEAYILFFGAQLNWLLLDNTWWGVGLASFIGVVCPLAEIPIVKTFGLWHYPRANVSLFGEGFVTWVICCYFFYTPFISNLARWLARYQKGLEEPKQ